MDLAPIEDGIAHLGGLLTRRRVIGLALAHLAMAQIHGEADAKRKKKKKVRICHKGQTISVASSKVKTHLGHGDFKGECPADPGKQDPDPNDPKDPNNPDPVCPGFPGYVPGQASVDGPACPGGGSGTFGYSVRRVAQPFVAQQTGGVVSIQLTLRNDLSQIVPNTIYTLDLREVDQSGVPTQTVLGSVDVSVGSNPSNPFVLTGTFACPVAVTSGKTYAMAITTEVANMLAVLVGNNACAEQMYSDIHADGTFSQAGSADLLFSTRMVV